MKIDINFNLRTARQRPQVPAVRQETTVNAFDQVSLKLRDLGYIYSGAAFDETTLPSDLKLVDQLPVTQHLYDAMVAVTARNLARDIEDQGAISDEYIPVRPHVPEEFPQAHGRIRVLNGINADSFDAVPFSDFAETVYTFWPVDRTRAYTARSRVLFVPRESGQTGIVIAQRRLGPDAPWQSGPAQTLTRFLTSLPKMSLRVGRQLETDPATRDELRNILPIDIPSEDIRQALGLFGFMGLVPSTSQHEWPRQYLRDAGNYVESYSFVTINENHGRDARDIRYDSDGRIVADEHIWVNCDIVYHDARRNGPLQQRNVYQAKLDDFIDANTRSDMLDPAKAEFIASLPILPRKHWHSRKTLMNAIADGSVQTTEHPYNPATAMDMFRHAAKNIRRNIHRELGRRGTGMRYAAGFVSETVSAPNTYAKIAAKLGNQIVHIPGAIARSASAAWHREQPCELISVSVEGTSTRILKRVSGMPSVVSIVTQGLDGVMEDCMDDDGLGLTRRASAFHSPQI